MSTSRLLCLALLGGYLTLAAGTAANAEAPVATAIPMLSASLGGVECGFGRPGPVAQADIESARMQKADAILGGAPSALERIRMSQAGTSAYATSTSQQSSSELAVSSDLEAARCLVAAAPSAKSLAFSYQSPLVTGRAVGTEFLASTRIRISRTPFDQAWDRVSASRLTAAQVASSMGAPESDPVAKIRQVNRWANHAIAYREDAALWHKRDYWADARSTLRKHAGDCEDIAIVKYQALIGLGFDPADVYLTIARDLVRDADHALVVVRYDGRYYLLDDSTDELLDGSEANDYRPMLSFGTGKWLHGLQPVAESPIYLSRNALSNARSIGINR